jgi:hypothetical protein
VQWSQNKIVLKRIYRPKNLGSILYLIYLNCMKRLRLTAPSRLFVSPSAHFNCDSTERFWIAFCIEGSIRANLNLILSVQRNPYFKWNWSSALIIRVFARCVHEMREFRRIFGGGGWCCWNLLLIRIGQLILGYFIQSWSRSLSDGHMAAEGLDPLKIQPTGFIKIVFDVVTI